MSKRFLFFGIILSALFSCTTEVELCESKHPHTAEVTFSYDWSDVTMNKLSLPQKMYVVSNRIINSKISNFFYDTKKESVTKTMAAGYYKFLTLSYDPKDFTYTNLEEHIKGNNKIMTSDMQLQYITYFPNSTDDDLHNKDFNIGTDAGGFSGWVDENQYTHTDGTPSGFVRSKTAILRDSIELMEIKLGMDYDVKFRPKSLSHNIDVYFDLKKDVDNIAFTIDSVFCIISGVPHSIRISDGALTVTNTDKTMFRTMFVDSKQVPSTASKAIEDNTQNDIVRCYQNIDVTGIVANAELQEKVFTGPGIMQVIIFTTIYNKEGGKTKKRIQGMINLYNAIEKAHLQEVKDLLYYKTEDHSDLFIDIDQMLSKEMLEGDENNYGFPGWKIVEYHIDDKGGNIEL